MLNEGAADVEGAEEIDGWKIRSNERQSEEHRPKNYMNLSSKYERQLDSPVNLVVLMAVPMGQMTVAQMALN